eukprot:gene17076-20481_t
MARLEFYFNDTDRADLLEFIQANKGIVIPDKLYDSPCYKVIADYEELTGHLKNDISHYFLLNSEINVEPLVLGRNRFISEEKYYINQRKGGPYIDFSFYTGHAEDSVIPYRKSIIELYPKFIHFDSHQEFNVTVELPIKL